VNFVANYITDDLLQYDGLRAQAVSMKQRYESRISELLEEATAAEQVRESLESKLNLAIDAGRKLKTQIAASGSSLGGTVVNQPQVPDVQTEAGRIFAPNTATLFVVCFSDVVAIRTIYVFVCLVGQRILDTCWFYNGLKAAVCYAL
jgi:hypothetical protein